MVPKVFPSAFLFLYLLFIRGWFHLFSFVKFCQLSESGGKDKSYHIILALLKPVPLNHCTCQCMEYVDVKPLINI